MHRGHPGVLHDFLGAMRIAEKLHCEALEPALVFLDELRIYVRGHEYERSRPATRCVARNLKELPSRESSASKTELMGEST